ncbi:hypothetical protein L6452_22865 [Arctium lappa]|uniref:Uncharacterized protein n=1 Tax=Arctium lappa TaxID=4217 RepID=A0ACB9B0D3_ARCLA|nr:hypothetical protein L6452_22865 [Arctium lappa]
MRGCTTFVEPAGRAVSPGQLRTPESKPRTKRQADMRGCTTFVEPAGRAVSPGQLRTPESKVRALDACGIPSKCWDFSSIVLMLTRVHN